MAKRMLLHFQSGHFPAYEKADEQGMPQPCALGVPWVNEDTQRTLAKLRIPRTDPWGRPLPDATGGWMDADPDRTGIRANPPAGPRDGLIADESERGEPMVPRGAPPSGR